MKNTTITTAIETRPGFVIWGLICLLIAVIGFWPSYVAPSFAGTYTSKASMLPWHVLSSAFWLVLIVSQPMLVQLDKMRMHRFFGFFGAFVAFGVVVTGVIVQIEVMGPYAARGDIRNAVGLPFFRLIAMLVFAICVSAAIALRGRPDWHKRLMILGTFALLEAPLVRMYENVFGFQEISGLLGVMSHILLMILFVIWDRRVQGRFHPVTLWGAILITLIVFGVGPIPRMEWWREVAAWLVGN